MGIRLEFFWLGGITLSFSQRHFVCRHCSVMIIKTCFATHFVFLDSRAWLMLDLDCNASVKKMLPFAWLILSTFNKIIEMNSRLLLPHPLTHWSFSLHSGKNISPFCLSSYQNHAYDHPRRTVYRLVSPVGGILCHIILSRFRNNHKCINQCADEHDWWTNIKRRSRNYAFPSRVYIII